MAAGANSRGRRVGQLPRRCTQRAVPVTGPASVSGPHVDVSIHYRSALGSRADVRCHQQARPLLADCVE